MSAPRRALPAALALLVFAGPAAAHQAATTAPSLSPTSQATGDGPSPAQTAPTGPAVPPSEPGSAAAAFAPRSGPQCADFRAGPGASWQALASVTFPGPQGSVRISAGQTVSPGAYVFGMDLAAILQARCF